MFTGPYSYHFVLLFTITKDQGLGFAVGKPICAPKLNSPLLPDPQGPAFCLTFLPPLFARTI